KEAGEISYNSIVEAANYSKKFGIPLYTAPVSKKSINIAGFSFSGHTELLRKIFEVEVVSMFIFSGHMRFLFLTEHIRIDEVIKNLDPLVAYKKLKIANNFLEKFIHNPKWVLLGVNPHAEFEFDVEFFKNLKNLAKDVYLELYPADSACMHIKNAVFDAGIAPYHDVAMAALKVFDSSRIVNLTLGLPILRASPGHGVGYNTKVIDFNPAITAMKFLYESKVRSSFFKR
ncbi:MAG: 4-hydroxythreonine-4-phosphate dehydrogenase PdxA, partial [bacterium]|nr:4-hydroxythreonine-4-phosphate dehydrogenase PdxA [bacterium]